ncbi:hypothetical protein [Cupriavidus oxalaticus]|uniref:VWA domain-containing protein n=1 Tax=Cupriavidus oxalaticus TaxID=96344 RepID=A0A5P3VCP0_9BURK|nr:hypothetical protein [Cupriavidus oxalaticus]QEZ44154.1 hypothetical protein D2917_07865 [Cupriavidus oxalaticus]
MSKPNKWMWPSVVASVLLLAAILVASQLNKKPKLDAHGCGLEPAGKTVFVIDQSEDLTEQTKAEVVARAMKVVDEKVKAGELVSVFSITELSKKNLVPVFSYCKPSREGSRVTSNPKLLERIYREKFAKPLEKALRMPIPGSKESPVAQAIVDLSLSEHLNSPAESRLVVFSDLMEHTDKFSLYGCKAAQEAISRFRYARGATVARPAFKDVEIELNIVPRPNIPAPVGKCRDAFWVWFFGDNEGARASLTPNYLPG